MLSHGTIANTTWYVGQQIRKRDTENNTLFTLLLYFHFTLNFRDYFLHMWLTKK